MAKTQGRKKPEEDLKSAAEWEEELKQRWIKNKNKDLTFTPKFSDKIYSVDQKKMIPRAKSTGRIGTDTVERF